jgi:hypothetical protein
MHVPKVDKPAMEQMQANRVNDRSTVTQTRGRDGAQHCDLYRPGKVFVREGRNLEVTSGNRVEWPRAVVLRLVGAREESMRKYRDFFESLRNARDFGMVQEGSEAFLKRGGVGHLTGALKDDELLGLAN